MGDGDNMCELVVVIGLSHVWLNDDAGRKVGQC